MEHDAAVARTYVEEMGLMGLGYPLWHPEPAAAGEIQLGDVGVLQDGQFHRLFNVLVGPTHPWNSRGVPEDFEPLALGRQDVSMPSPSLPPGWLFNSRLRSVPAERKLLSTA